MGEAWGQSYIDFGSADGSQRAEWHLLLRPWRERCHPGMLLLRKELTSSELTSLTEP